MLQRIMKNVIKESTTGQLTEMYYGFVKANSLRAAQGMGADETLSEMIAEVASSGRSSTVARPAQRGGLLLAAQVGPHGGYSLPASSSRSTATLPRTPRAARRVRGRTCAATWYRNQSRDRACRAALRSLSLPRLDRCGCGCAR